MIFQADFYHFYLNGLIGSLSFEEELEYFNGASCFY